MRGFVSFFGAVSRLVWDVQSTMLRLLDLVFPPELSWSMTFMYPCRLISYCIYFQRG